MSESVWYCAKCRCPNAPLRASCAVCGTAAPGAVPAARSAPPVPLPEAPHHEAKIVPKPPVAPRPLEPVRPAPHRLLEPGRRPTRVPPPRRDPAPAAADPTSVVPGDVGHPVREGPPRCPACARPLEPFAVEGVAAARCPACAGLWFDAGLLRQAVHAPIRPPSPAERQALRARVAHDPAGRDLRPPLPCSRCGAPMERKRPTEIGPVWIDVCTAHGVWFDGGEFERYAAFVAEGGLSLPPPLRVRHPPPLLANEPRSEGPVLFLLNALFAHRRRW